MSPSLGKRDLWIITKTLLGIIVILFITVPLLGCSSVKSGSLKEQRRAEKKESIDLSAAFVGLHGEETMPLLFNSWMIQAQSVEAL